MTFDSFDVIFYTLAFLVPGFILQSTISALVPQKGEDTQLTLLRFLTLSCINYALWSWLIYLIFQAQFFLSSLVWTVIAWTLIILISPFVIGLIVGNSNQRGFVRKFLQRLGFNPIHIIPTAWDFKFSGTTSPRWVIVTLTDGNVVAGRYGENSFSSSSSSERDLYIEQIYKISEEGVWEEIDRTDGMLVKADSIAYVEFRN